MKKLSLLASLLTVLLTSCLKTPIDEVFDHNPKVKPPSISYTQSAQAYTVGTTISPLTPTNTGGVSTSYTINPALPSGLAIAASTGAISGTPTAAHVATNYTVTARNAGGTSAATLNLSVTVANVTDGSYFSVMIQDDSLSTHTDNSLIYYSSTASAYYVPGEDALVSQGSYIHLESMAKYAANGIWYTMAVNKRPFKSGEVIPYKIGASAGSIGGHYHIYLDRSTMPAGVQIWLRDAKLKDSLEISDKITQYHFTAFNADTSSMGDQRFSIAVR